VRRKSAHTLPAVVNVSEALNEPNTVSVLIETGHHPAPQAAIEFNAEIARLNLRFPAGVSAAIAREHDANTARKTIQS